MQPVQPAPAVDTPERTRAPGCVRQDAQRDNTRLLLSEAAHGCQCAAIATHCGGDLCRAARQGFDEDARVLAKEDTLPMPVHNATAAVGCSPAGEA